MMGCRQGMPPSLAVLLNSKGFLCMSRTSKILLEGPTLLNMFSGRVLIMLESTSLQILIHVSWTFGFACD